MPLHPSIFARLTSRTVQAQEPSLLSPSRDNFIIDLRDLNDDWLNECGGYGVVSQVLSRVDVLFVFLIHAPLPQID
jgi:hypothetical protein